MGTRLHPDLIVNGEKVPQSVVAGEVQHHDAPKGKPGIAWRKATNAIAVRTLLLQEARAQNIAIARDEVSPGRFETDEEAQIRGLLEASISVKKPSDEAIKDEWSRAPERFRAPPLWEVSHILFACDPRDEEAKQQAFQRAQTVLKKALTSGAKFSALAKQFSDCGSKSSGGALGQLGPGDTVPEFEAVLRTLSEGAITPEPVLTRHGWHIVRMDALAEGQILPFDSVKRAIAEALEKAAWTSAAREFIDALVAHATIEGADLQGVKG